MNNTYFSERLKDKIDIYLKNKSLENILLEWLVEGHEKEKLDTYQILKNLDFIIEKISVSKYPISSKDIKNNLIKLITDLLLSPRYSFVTDLPMNDIESRAWLTTCLCLCSKDCDDIKKTIQYISLCFENDSDNYTKFYALDGLLNCTNIQIKCYFQEVNKIILRFKICDNINSEISDEISKYQFLVMLWYIRHRDNPLFEDIQDKIVLFQNKINSIFNNLVQIKLVSDLLFSYGCQPVSIFVDNIINILERILKDEKKKKLAKFNYTFYHYLIRSCIGIRYINDEILNKKKEDIAQLVFNFLKILRNYTDSIWNPIVSQVLRCIRKYYQILGTNIIIDNLHHELLNEDTNLVTNACKTLQTFYQINNSTNIILEAVNKEIEKCGKNFSSNTIIALSNALKWMSSKDTSVLEALEDKMYRGDTEAIRDIARRLISEMGGANAIKKLEIRKILKDSYTDRINKAQQDIERMFHTTIIDAKRGFNISMSMEILVFLSGLSLLLLSGYMAVLNDDDSVGKWAGTSASGGTGLLSILYTLFISKPREKVKDNVTHLMYLKIIFLGYLRELNQIDQSFNQHILEEEIISSEKMKIFYQSIDNVMTSCLKLLKLNKDQAKEQLTSSNESLTRNISYSSLSNFVNQHLNNTELADKIKENKIDSDTIIEMEPSGWIELGIDSGINQAKISSNIKKELVKNI